MAISILRFTTLERLNIANVTVDLRKENSTHPHLAEYNETKSEGVSNGSR